MLETWQEHFEGMGTKVKVDWIYLKLAPLTLPVSN